MKHLVVSRLEPLPYPDFLERQERVWNERVGDKRPDTLIFASHPHTISLGARPEDAQLRHLYVSDTELKALGIPLIRTRRGGDITYHGPGVLGIYPICRLSDRLDISSFLEHLGKALIEVLRTYQLTGRHRADVGSVQDIWVGNGKITAVGIRIHECVTLFGANFNVSPDLRYFDLIAPCGIEDCVSTSMAKELSFIPSWDEVIDRALTAFVELGGYEEIKEE